MLAQSYETQAGIVRVVCTAIVDGDFAVAQEPNVLDPLRRAIVDQPWTWLRQVHGADVVTVSEPGEEAGAVADAAITGCVGAPVAVTTADCAPVVLVGSTAVGVIHAGWKGLVAGVIEATAGALQETGSEPVAAFLGPCIQAAHYEFGDGDLALVADRYGPGVKGVTAQGRAALDMTAGVQAACAAAGWPAPDPPLCTSGVEFFSHRTRQDPGRQTTVAWIEA